MTAAARIRCAIYTRKSSEEGLEQDFNSLDAQREACEAYIRSQAALGWTPVRERYDDGGHSGGTLERPALQQLLDDIRAHRIDVIVLYKIDRLTRSLTDFAKLAELFDAQGVSFVSVTQQFNTTTSMGRLMLNVLLSFAQFEREITGERIRDKIAASKQRGLWMGGFVPLGYDARERSLVINRAEAETVQKLFSLYLELGCVRKVQAAAEQLRLRTKRRQSVSGRGQGGQPFSRGHLYRILQTPVYIGQIAHKEKVHPGLHEPIIDTETWTTVQAQLARNGHAHRTRATAKEPSLLAGLLFDEEGNRYIPSHAVKAGRRYRYYVHESLLDGTGKTTARARRIPANEIEALVREGVADLLASPAHLSALLGKKVTARTLDAATGAAAALQAELVTAEPGVWLARVRLLLKQVVLTDDAVRLCCLRAGARAVLDVPDKHDPIDDESYEMIIPIKLRNRGSQLKLVTTAPGTTAPREPDPALVKAIARAHDWFRQLRTGAASSVRQIAESEGVTGSYITRILRLAFLPPDIVQAIVEGRHPIELTADRLTLHENIALDWVVQRSRLS